MTGVIAEHPNRPLPGLLRKAREEGGDTYREIAARADSAGHDGLSFQQVQSYAADQVRKVPTRAQMEALAAGLGVDFDTVLEACLEQWYNYVPPELTGAGERIGRLIPDDLSTEDEQELRRMVQAWIAAKRFR